ncbi:MAG: YabP/YqfC family sporulation protein [Lachnospiraceae bacterium]|nr:YabP/YqfC family sporulation protein [Lachnospiraceae bacterium]
MDIADIRAAMTGDHELTIENYKGIAEYQGDRILVCGKDQKLLVTGCELFIDYYSRFDLHILGRIESLQWLR